MTGTFLRVPHKIRSKNYRLLNWHLLRNLIFKDSSQVILQRSFTPICSTKYSYKAIPEAHPFWVKNEWKSAYSKVLIDDNSYLKVQLDKGIYSIKQPYIVHFKFCEIIPYTRTWYYNDMHL